MAEPVRIPAEAGDKFRRSTGMGRGRMAGSDTDSLGMKILLLPTGPWGPTWRAFMPGREPDPLRIFDLLAGQGLRTKLIDPHAWPWNPFGGRRTLYEGLDPLRTLGVLLRERDCDAVLTWSEAPALALLLLRRLFRFKPAIIAVDIGIIEWKVIRRMHDFIVPRLDAIFVLGTNQIEYINTHWKTNAIVEFVPQHVDTDFYRPAPDQPDGPVLSVGDDAGRDFDTLLKALEGIAAPVVIKSRYDNFDRTRYPNVELVPQRLPGVEFRRLYERSCFVVVPLVPMVKAGGISTLLEAMAMGKALIVSDSPGIRDYAIPDETCLLVPCGDAAALREAILRLLREPDTRARLAANARRFVEQNCSHPVHAAKLGEAIRRVVHAKRRRAGEP